MSELKYFVPSISDERVYDTFREAFESLEKLKKVEGLNLSFTTPFSNETFSIGNSNSIPLEKENLLKSGSNRAISSCRISFSNFSLVYSRTPNPPNGSYGELKVTISSRLQITDIEIHPIISEVIKNLYVGKVDQLLDADKNLITSHSEVLSKLESLGLDIQKDTKKFRDQLDLEHSEKRQQMESEFANKRKELEESYTLKNRDLDKIRKELDDKNNTHARREIRRDLISTIEKRIENFKLSKDTSSLRWPVHFAFILLVTLSGVGIFLYSRDYLALLENQKFLENTSAVAFGLLKPLGFTILFSTSFVFYIRWLIAWFDKNAEEEMMLRKFQLDVHRSSWIVETVLESVSQHKQQIPNELILKFANNLFVKNIDNGDKISHPIDDLASALLGSAAKTKLKIGDNEMEFDRKSKRDLQSH